MNCSPPRSFSCRLLWPEVDPLLEGIGVVLLWPEVDPLLEGIGVVLQKRPGVADPVPRARGVPCRSPDVIGSEHLLFLRRHGEELRGGFEGAVHDRLADSVAYHLHKLKNKECCEWSRGVQSKKEAMGE